MEKALIARAMGAGFVTGLRSQTVFAVLARAANRGDFGANCRAPISWLRRPLVGDLTTLSAAGEMIVDKLPQTPSRIDPQPLTGRLVFGAVAGGLVAGESGRSWQRGMLLGSMGALVGTFSGYWLRTRVVARTGLPDPIVALAEDAIAVGLGSMVVGRGR